MGPNQLSTSDSLVGRDYVQAVLINRTFRFLRDVLSTTPNGDPIAYIEKLFNTYGWQVLCIAQNEIYNSGNGTYAPRLQMDSYFFQEVLLPLFAKAYELNMGTICGAETSLQVVPFVPETAATFNLLQFCNKFQPISNTTSTVNLLGDGMNTAIVSEDYKIIKE